MSLAKLLGVGNGTALVPVVAQPSPVILPRPDTIEEMDTRLYDNVIDVSMTTNTPIVKHFAPKHDLNLSGTHQIILASADNFFFISYRGANTLHPRWYLVKNRLDDDEIPGSNQYFVDFFRKHPDDNKKKDDFARYWPNWYDIVWVDKENPCWDYGRPILVKPNRTPNIKNYSRISDTVDFTVENKLCVVPFDFIAKSPGIAGNQFIEYKKRGKLSEVCHQNGLVPPDLSSDPVTRTNTVFIGQDKRIVPWYHSSMALDEVIRVGANDIVQGEYILPLITRLFYHD